MSLPFSFSAFVNSDTHDAFDWYEAQRTGLGTIFLDAVQAVLDTVERTPLLYGYVVRDIRAALVHRFPYAVYYRVLNDRIRILAVHHTSRDPSGWQART